MDILLVKNIHTEDGTIDYKGLDINLVVPGTQLYTPEGMAFFKYNGEVVSHSDVEVISQEVYDAKKLELENNNPVDTIEVLKTKLASFEENQKSAAQKYLEIDKANATLEEVKLAKINALDEACNQSIVSGFDYTINAVSYHFSCSLSAQSNFIGSNTLFKDGLIQQAEWTVINNSTGKVERIIIDETTFNSLRLEVFKHINSNIYKLRNVLQPLVEAVEGETSVQEVDKVVW